MGFAGERGRTRVHGLLPEHGAIFMSNTRTKRECLRKKLFGLPSSLSKFVKNVKAGMVLFLFEYEKRELHGVFKAASDGEINIVPAAYGSSGKRFPAQVQVIRIWNCDPLSENEFFNAIKDNYFSTNKFHFGLSKHQVKQLLHLFSSRKVSRDSGLSTLRGLRNKVAGYHITSRKSEDPQSYDDRASKVELSSSTMKSVGYSVTTVPKSQVSLVGSEHWLSDGSRKNIARKQASDECCSDILEVPSLKYSPSCQISPRSLNLLASHPRHDLVMVKGHDCCNHCDESGESMPMFVPLDDERELVQRGVLPPDDQVKSAPLNTGGDQYLSDPYIPISKSSVNFLVESHPQHDLAMIKGFDCCNCSDELGDFIPLSVPFYDEWDLVEVDVLPPDDRTKSAPNTTGDQYQDLSDPYIPMPIFGGQSSEMVYTSQDSAVGPDKCLYPKVVVKSSPNAGQTKSVVSCQEPCCGAKVDEIPSTKGLYHDTPRERKSVFSRLNFASKEMQEKENRDRVDRFMDEIIGELQHKHDLGWKTMEGASSAEGVGGDINLRRISVFQRLEGVPSITKSTREKPLYSTNHTEHKEYMPVHRPSWDTVTPSTLPK